MQINVRSGPGTAFNSLGTLNARDVVSLVGRDATGTGLQIAYPPGPEGKGWLNAAFVQAQGVENLPILSEAGQAIGTATPTEIPPSPTPTLAPAPMDDDTAGNPIVSMTFSPSGTHTLIYNGDVSSPAGDREDWISFVPYSRQVLLEITCSSDSLIIEITQNPELPATGQCANGNYAVWPFTYEGQVMDINFQAASSILEVIKHYSILALSVYMMQTIALNTMTDTGAQASQVDSTQLAVFTFNSMMDGFAAQYDSQIGRRLYDWNKDQFPGLTKRPKIRFSHVENNIGLATLGSFLSSLNGIVPLGEDDLKAIRKRSGFLPENNPDLEETIGQAPVLDNEGLPGRAGVFTGVTVSVPRPNSAAPSAASQRTGFRRRCRGLRTCRLTLGDCALHYQHGRHRAAHNQRRNRWHARN